MKMEKKRKLERLQAEQNRKINNQQIRNLERKIDRLENNKIKVQNLIRTNDAEGKAATPTLSATTVIPSKT